MLRQRVSLGSAIPKCVVNRAMSNPNIINEDMSLQIADIEERADNQLEIPSQIADVVKEVIKDKVPNLIKNISEGKLSLKKRENVIKKFKKQKLTNVKCTPYIYEPLFSGLDVSFDNNENETCINEDETGFHVKCKTKIIPIDDPIPVNIYFTGKECDLNIEGQECMVNVTIDGETTIMTAVAKRDKDKYIYLEVQSDGKLWEAGISIDSIYFEIDNVFNLP